MREIEMTAKTVEEAVEAACRALGVDRDDLGVSYEVLEFPARRLFKSIPAKVRVTVEEPEAPAAPAAVPRADIVPLADVPLADVPLADVSSPTVARPPSPRPPRRKRPPRPPRPRPKPRRPSPPKPRRRRLRRRTPPRRRWTLPPTSSCRPPSII